MTFDRMAGGWYMTAVTEKALAFAQGDDNNLVAAAFARFLSERGVVFDWNADDPTKMTVGGFWAIEIAATRETGETMNLTGDGKTYRLYGNVTIPEVVVLMGLTYRTGEIPTRYLLSLDEFLKGVTPNDGIANAQAA